MNEGTDGQEPEPASDIPLLPVPRTAPARGVVARWMRGAPTGRAHKEPEHPWNRVLWLTGVDYFSTLGYQPGIALLAAGALSPIATAVLVVVTLLGAVPVYSQVARRSFAGQGSIAMLESLLSGWTGKILVLALLGVAATDFVITMTLSAADAAQHAVENPFLHPLVGDSRMVLTLGLLALLAVVFLKGFREAIGIATVVAVPYILLNLVVLLWGLFEIVQHPDLIQGWTAALSGHGDWTMVLIAAGLVFPKLALGLSGFETGVSVMPIIDGGAQDEHGAASGSVPAKAPVPAEEEAPAPVSAETPVPAEARAGPQPPEGRIAATRKLLLTSALIMSVMLVLSSFVTTLLVPPEAYARGGKAAGRAISYLAHDRLGEGFGTVYDLWTIAILWFAGASAMAGLLNLVPRYLPRFGMAPQWTAYRRPLVLLLFTVCVAVTWAFDADVEAQGGAYATGVLVLMLSAGFAVALALWHEAFAERAWSARIRGVVRSGYFWGVTAVLAFTLVDNVIERPDGVLIASIFILAILVFGGASRLRRATELRVAEVHFSDPDSERLWREITARRVNLIPLRTSSPEARRTKAEDLRRHYVFEGLPAFLHVRLADNRSEFLAPLIIRAMREDDSVVIEVSGALAVANTIAYASELLHPARLFIGLTRRNLMTQAFRYLLWGEGETGLMVYKILLRYWEWRDAPGDRPLIFLMSE